MDSDWGPKHLHPHQPLLLTLTSHIVLSNPPFDHHRINTSRNKCVTSPPPSPTLVQRRGQQKEGKEMRVDYVGLADAVREGAGSSPRGEWLSLRGDRQVCRYPMLFVLLGWDKTYTLRSFR